MRRRERDLTVDMLSLDSLGRSSREAILRSIFTIALLVHVSAKEEVRQASTPTAEVRSAAGLICKQSTFTGVVGVQTPESTLDLRASGLANKFYNVPMATDAVFRIGSNSKLFVAVALYQLQERGVLKVSDLVSKHLGREDFIAFGLENQTEWCPRVYPATSGPCRSPTIAQLLGMGSGIVDVTNCGYPEGSPLLAYCWGLSAIFRQTGAYPNKALQLVDGFYSGSMAKVIGNFISNPLSDEPGSTYHYTNANFVLATWLVGKYADSGLGRYLDEHILGPLKLHDTHLDNYGPSYSIAKYPKLPSE